MRVVADAPGRTVLYQAPDTAFRGARTPTVMKIRDFWAEWVSMDLVWAGGSLIRLIEPDAWQCINVDSTQLTSSSISWWQPMAHGA